MPLIPAIFSIIEGKKTGYEQKWLDICITLSYNLLTSTMKPRRKPHVRLLAVTFGLSLCLLSCSSEPGKKGGLTSIFEDDTVPFDAFKTAMSGATANLNTADSLFRKNLLNDIELNVRYAYLLSENEPLWFESDGLKSSTADIVPALSQLSGEGLDTGRYNLGYIRSILGRIKGRKDAGLPVDSVVLWDKTFTTAYLSAARDLLLGMKDIKKGDNQWFAANDTAFNGAQYLVQSYKGKKQLPSLDTFRPQLKTYKQMIAALAQWQKLKQDTVYIALKSRLAPGDQDSSLQAMISRELPGVAVSDNDTLNVTRQMDRCLPVLSPAAHNRQKRQRYF